VSVRVDHADVVDVVTAVRAQCRSELEGAHAAGELLIERELRVLDGWRRTRAGARW